MVIWRIRALLRQIEPICATLNGALRVWRGGKTDLRLAYIVCRTTVSGNDPEPSRQALKGA
jgi:hypothetical protein